MSLLLLRFDALNAGWQVPNLRHDAGAAVVVTEVRQLLVSDAVQLLEQWTQPLEPGTVDTAFGPQL